MKKKIVLYARQFKNLEAIEKLIVIILLFLMVRLTWPLLQILYTVVCNIISLHSCLT